MALIKPTPYQMVNDQARIAGIQSVVKKPPMVPTNNPGATRAIGAQQIPQKRTLLPPAPILQPSQNQMHAQNFAPGSGAGIGDQQKPIGGALQGMVQKYLPPSLLSTSAPVNPNDAVGDKSSGQIASDNGVGFAGGAGLRKNADGSLTQTMNGEAAPPAEKSNAELRDDAIRELLGGGTRDTKAEEALIQQLMGDQIGQGLVDQRASMGRAGGGFSGAQQALEGDVQRKAREDALQQIFGVQQGARDEHRKDIEAGLDADRLAQDQAFTDWLRQQLVAQGDSAPPGAGGGEDPPADDADPDGLRGGQTVADRETNHLSERADATGGQRAEQAAAEQPYPPADGVLVDSDDTYDYYVVNALDPTTHRPTGKPQYVKVRKG
jgi:hypothetical protein